MPATDRREAIIQAAWGLFTGFGYKATTIDGIARAAGIGKGTVYNYFATKEDVLYAIVDRSTQGMSAYIDAFVARALAKAAPIRDLVGDFLAGVIDWREDFVLYRGLVREAQAFGSPEVASAVSRYDRRFETELARLFRSLAAGGLIPERDADLLAGILIEAYSALLGRRREDGSPLGGGEISDVLAAMLVGGLLG
jgi:AcrR family transcriptional regulator